MVVPVELVAPQGPRVRARRVLVVIVPMARRGHATVVRVVRVVRAVTVATVAPVGPVAQRLMAVPQV